MYLIPNITREKAEVFDFVPCIRLYDKKEFRMYGKLSSYVSIYMEFDVDNNFWWPTFEVRDREHHVVLAKVQRILWKGVEHEVLAEVIYDISYKRSR